MIKMKRYKAISAIVLFLICSFLASCSVEFEKTAGSGQAGSGQAEIIPDGYYPAIRSRTICLDDSLLITLPDAYHYAEREIEAVDSAGNHVGAYKAWYGFKKDVRYIRPDDEDIIFYAFKGTDLVTPDTDLSASQAERSLRAYIQYFVDEKTKRSRPILAAGGGILDINQDEYLEESYWIYPFYAYDNRESITSTYNTLLYPKYYYGVCILDREASSLPSRNWYLFVFSNDASGELMAEDGYKKIFDVDIKEQFGLSIFPTRYTEEDVQKRLEVGIDDTDPLLVAPAGYDYEQLLLLFSGTLDYYRVKPNIEQGQDTELPAEESAEESQRYEGLYAVLEVVDGDTIDVDVDGVRTRIRLIGIDTPESVHPDESLNVPEGKEAAGITKELIEQYGGYVYLEMGEGDSKDNYSRTLAYVYVTDGKYIIMLNRLLIEQGYARVMTVDPNTRYAGDFENLEKKAKKEKTGFWGSGFFN